MTVERTEPGTLAALKRQAGSTTGSPLAIPPRSPAMSSRATYRDRHQAARRQASRGDQRVRPRRADWFDTGMERARPDAPYDLLLIEKRRLPSTHQALIVGKLRRILRGLASRLTTTRLTVCRSTSRPLSQPGLCSHRLRARSPFVIDRGGKLYPASRAHFHRVTNRATTRLSGLDGRHGRPRRRSRSTSSMISVRHVGTKGSGPALPSRLSPIAMSLRCPTAGAAEKAGCRDGDGGARLEALESSVKRRQPDAKIATPSFILKRARLQPITAAYSSGSTHGGERPRLCTPRGKIRRY